MVSISSVYSDWREDGSSHISISGIALKDFGFETGEKIVIDVSHKKIVVKPIDMEE